MKNIDWEQFIMNTLANNFVLHMRIFKKSKEKLNQMTQTSMTQSSLFNDETYLLDTFFDLEADFEKGICRDEISNGSNGKEQEFLQEICELLCYELLYKSEFDCVPFRCLIRESLANLAIKDLVDILADPDYINQTLIWLMESQPILVENFLLTINFNENVDELSEINMKIDEEISKTRAQDKGGENDREIKLQLSSLQYLKRRIDQNINNLKSNNGSSGGSNAMFQDDDVRSLNYSQNSIDFEIVLTNEMIQHCFIEYMGSNNAQNLISFYLNAQMYPKFAKTEMESQRADTKIALTDFAKGLINSYLIQNTEEDLTNVSNIIFYKDELRRALERMENPDLIDEYLLDELQAKVYLLMKEKYYPEFRQCVEFNKLIAKNDLMKSILSTSLDDYLLSPTNEGNFNGDSDTHSISSMVSSTGSTDINAFSFEPEHVSANFNLVAVITSSGFCNDLKSKYAIYIIDVKKLYENPKQNEYWQTYRRFNDFHDLHLTIKKKFPALSNLALPGKSLRHTLNEEFLDRRRIELNRYLSTLCNHDVISSNTGLLSLILKFLENKRWETSQTNFTRRVDSFLTPVLTSVHNIQATIKKTPDNVIGMVKGISDNLSNTVESITKIIPTPNMNGNNGTPHNQMTSNNSEKDLVLMERSIIDESANNVGLRVMLAIIDEIFDLKERNQWFRQSLIAIIKGILKSFKGNSMNRKIKEQIADYISEENVARCLKRIRKRIWPKGVRADPGIPRSKTSKDITKILVKTKMLALVSDELRRMLSSDTTRRGLFNLFEMFQYKALNKRFIYVIIENLLMSLFQESPQSSQTTKNTFKATKIQNQLSQYIHHYLSKSARVKPEWKQSNNNGYINLINAFSKQTPTSTLPRSKNFVQC